MDKIYILLMIFGYFIFLFSCYIFTIKRLKYLNQKHIEYTKVDWLIFLYKKLIKITFIFFVVLFIISFFIILIFL